MNWNIIKQNIVYDGAVYLALVENFNKQAHFDYANDCYYKYNIRTKKPSITDFFALVLCEYGIYTRNISIWSAFFIAIYVLFNTTLKDYETIGAISEKVLSWIIVPLLIVIFSKKFSKWFLNIPLWLSIKDNNLNYKTSDEKKLIQESESNHEMQVQE